MPDTPAVSPGWSQYRYHSTSIHFVHRLFFVTTIRGTMLRLSLGNGVRLRLFGRHSVDFLPVVPRIKALANGVVCRTRDSASARGHPHRRGSGGGGRINSSPREVVAVVGLAAGCYSTPGKRSRAPNGS